MVKLECTDRVISTGTREKQLDYLNELNKVTGKKTDVTIPCYKISKHEFEEIWPPHKLDGIKCEQWTEIFEMQMKREEMRYREYHNDKYDAYEIHKKFNRILQDLNPCKGRISAVSHIVFVDDVYYMQLKDKEIINSPGIYIKDEKIDTYILDFILAYNIHLAEIFYLTNRMFIDLDSIEYEMSKSFIASLATIRSISKKDKKLADSIIQKCDHLVGDWKVPFLLIQKLPTKKDKLNQTLDNTEVKTAIKDLISGMPKDPDELFERLWDSFLDY